jgi:ABC-2 type transport system permease protein
VPVAEFISLFSFTTHFNALQRGVIDTRDLVFFLSVIGTLLAATMVILENKKHE